MSELINFLTDLLGGYQPITYQTKYWDDVNSSWVITNVIPDGLAGVDWRYIIAGILFIACVICTFKLLGALISRAWR